MSPPAPKTLNPPTDSEAHVWAVWLNGPDDVVGMFRSYLSSKEAERASRYAFERLRRQYEISQGTLRLLLANYCGCRPADVDFAYGTKGKPSLAKHPWLHFNMSHSGGLALYAFTAGSEIGVDVEAVRGVSELKEISEFQFCPAEASELISICDPVDQLEAFFRCWTRKESYIKAIGAGLYMPLNQFQVTLLAQDLPRIVHIEHETAAATEWTLHHLEPAAKYVGALAYHGRRREIAQYGPFMAGALLGTQGAGQGAR